MQQFVNFSGFIQQLYTHRLLLSHTITCFLFNLYCIMESFEFQYYFHLFSVFSDYLFYFKNLNYTTSAVLLFLLLANYAAKKSLHFRSFICIVTTFLVKDYSFSFSQIYPHCSSAQTCLFPFSNIIEPHFGHFASNGLAHDIKSHSGISIHPK